MGKNNIIIATDSFKGSLSSLEVAKTIKEGLMEQGCNHEILTYGISDGGEGFAEIVTQALGGKMIEVDCHDALKRPIRAYYGITNDNCAIMDVASTIGISHLRPIEHNPWTATSFGVGEMIHHIITKGIRKIIIGLGGSATNDCGRGMLEALIHLEGLDDCEFTIATDVINPLCGPNGATYMFASQKGASPAILPRLEQRNREFGQMLELKTGRSIIDQSGSGAAGGIGAALMTMKHYKMVKGINLLLDLYNFKSLLADAALVITGEGKIDLQTLQGKAPYGIALMAKEMGVPCIAICGQISEEVRRAEGTGIQREMPWAKIIQVSPPDQLLSESMRPDVARENIRNCIGQLL